MAKRKADSDTEEEETLFLLDTAAENGRSFAACYVRYSTVRDFLRREEHIAMRATTISRVVDQEELIHQSDIDGITIEWKCIGNGLKSDFRHFNVLSRGAGDLKPFFPLIKKHVNRSLFTAENYGALKCSVGTQLIYDGTWETWLGFVPTRNMQVAIDAQLQSRMVLNYLNRLKVRFEEELLKLHRNGLARETLAKNNLSDASRLFVLPGHQSHILQAFQEALDETELLDLANFRPMLLTFRFGEKLRNELVLPVHNRECVAKVCLHIAHNISADGIDLFWARQGLQQVTGSRCVMTTALSLFECANAQTLKDRSELSISRDLPGNILFFQLYNDLPHRYPQTRVHPVSSSVMMMEGLLSIPAQRNLYDAALRYISEVRNNFVQFDKGVCRMEMVLELNDVPDVTDASHFIRLDGVTNLLASHAMIVPVHRGYGVLNKIQNVGLHLCEVLQQSFSTRRGTGDSTTVWIAYQAELAIEKMLWGRPLSYSSNLCSINLGPGLQYPTRCLTDQKGFMCLENCFSCCLDDSSLPPLKLFSNNMTVQQQIINVNGLYSLIGGSQSVLGSFLIRMFLKDCHTHGKIFESFESFFLRLKTASGNAGKRIVGGVSADELSTLLTTARRYAWPFVFGAAKKLLRDANIDVQEVLKHGLRQLGVGYFPALKRYDQSRHEGLDWKFQYGYWVLTAADSEFIDIERKSAEMHMWVLTELETRKLCHVSQYKDIEVFPWIRCILERTLEKKLPRAGMISITAFVSCVAFIQSGRYVDFYALSRLERDLPISQTMLQMLQVQSKFLLPSVHTSKIYRLHPSVPIKLVVSDSSKNKALERDQPQESGSRTCDEESSEQINPVEDELLVAGSNDVPVVHLPSNRCLGRWSSVELALLHEAESLSELSQHNRYMIYQNLCRQTGIPDRSFHAYRIKAKRPKPD